jgi:hypothetical protein
VTKNWGVRLIRELQRWVKTRLHQDERGWGVANEHSCLNTSHGQCLIETSTFPPARQVKAANHRMQMYISWWGLHVHVLWKWVQTACVYDLSWLLKKLRTVRETEEIGKRAAGRKYDVPESCIRDWWERRKICYWKVEELWGFSVGRKRDIPQ